MLGNDGFDLWADGYDEAVGVSNGEQSYPFAGYKDVLGKIFAEIMTKDSPDVLDIGFGTGTLTAKLYEGGCRIFGQDFSERMIEIASKKMPEAVLVRKDFAEGLDERLTARRYDFIVATYSLHHLTDEQKVPFIGSLVPLLKDGGKIFIGDVAFETRDKLEKCRREAGDDWDDEEAYFVFDEMKDAFPGMRFEKLSFCAGILTIGR